MSSCAICGEPRSYRESDPHGVFGYHEYEAAPEEPRTAVVSPQAKQRDAAFRAAAWGVIATAAKDRQDEAKAELQALEPGDTIAAKVNGELIGKATMTRGRSKLVVTDHNAFVNWVAAHHPTEIVSQVNPAFIKHLETRAKEYGQPIDTLGELIPGVELQDGEPYISVRKEKDAAAIVAQLLSSGRVQLDGIKALETK